MSFSMFYIMKYAQLFVNIACFQVRVYLWTFNSKHVAHFLLHVHQHTKQHIADCNAKKLPSRYGWFRIEVLNLYILVIRMDSKI